jgi:hypothetical protein
MLQAFLTLIMELSGHFPSLVAFTPCDHRVSLHMVAKRIIPDLTKNEVLVIQPASSQLTDLS